MMTERGLGMDGPLSSPNMEQGRKFFGSLFSEEGQEISLIGEGISIEGTLHFEAGVVRLDGRWQGKIIGGGTVIIGEKGLLQGDLQVSKLILTGRLEGTAATSESTHIAPTGKLFGTVRTSRLVIDEGGILEGKSQYLEREGPGTSFS